MDRSSLERQLKRAKLVIGDIKDTCATFLRESDPAPIGCMLHDLDFYSSTHEALKLLDADASHFLPRVFMYFDDVIGDDVWLCNEYTGQRLAIEEFNETHTEQEDLQKLLCSEKIPLSHLTFITTSSIRDTMTSLRTRSKWVISTP